MAVLAFCLASAATTARAQVPPSLETWVDVCDVTDPDLLLLTQAEAAMIAPGFLELNLDGTYHLVRQPFEYIPSEGKNSPLCPGSRFYGQPRPDGFPAGRSAFLVGPDLVLTANHQLPPGVLPKHAFVFGFHIKIGPSGACDVLDLDRIPASNVYRAREIVKDGGLAQDFLLLRLDRAVEGRPFVRVRRSGSADVGDRVTVVGHPEMLPTKVDLAGTYEGSSGDEPLINGVHTLYGSSGSMVYNRDKQVVESAVRTFSCARYDLAAGTHCSELVSDCSGGPYPLGHPVRSFAPYVPAFELVVDSLDEVVHVAPVGGPLPNPETTYRISAPATAAGPIAYHVTPPGPAPDAGPTLDLVLSGLPDGRLSPGQTLGAKTTASIDGVPCGRYVRSFEVQDLSHGYTDTLRHVFEIGLAEFQVTPSTGLNVEDLAPPYAATATYEVRNSRPTAATVQVGADHDWITLNEGPAPAPGSLPSLTLTLAPAGEPGDRATVRVGIGGSANALPLGTWYYGRVSFTNVSGTCEDRGDTWRRVSFLPGQGDFASQDTPLPVPDNQPAGVASRIDIPEDFCVADVDVSVFTSGSNANNLRVELVSPGGQTVRLWDHHGDPMTNIWRRFDDATAPAPTGQLLSTFNGRRGRGVWELRLADDVPRGENTLQLWSLALRSSGTPPCPADAGPWGR